MSETVLLPVACTWRSACQHWKRRWMTTPRLLLRPLPMAMMATMMAMTTMMTTSVTTTMTKMADAHRRPASARAVAAQRLLPLEAPEFRRPQPFPPRELEHSLLLLSVWAPSARAAAQLPPHLLALLAAAEGPVQCISS